MSDYKVKRGYDVPLVGAPEATLEDAGRPEIVAVRPTEFRAVRPKILVKDGETVQAGQPLFHDRKRPEIRFPSPAGGEVVEVSYGARRVCQEIYIRVADPETWVEHTAYGPDGARGLSRAQIVETLLDSGLWTSIRRRPFSVIPDAEALPDGIFIAGSDAGPLPLDPALAMEGREADLQLGIDLLAKLTEGKIHLCLPKNGSPCAAFRSATGCEKHTFSGPYPSGKIEVQAHYVMPHKKGQELWYLDCQDAADIGELFRTGKYPVARVVAVGGENTKARKHFRTRRGVMPASLIGNGVAPGNTRFVSGSVLGGEVVTSGCGLGHYDNKFSVIPEGDEPEFFGWMLPGFGKVSRYRAYGSAIAPPKRPHVTAKLGGGVRAHVATGIYEEVCAVDIYPAYLMKSVLIRDFEEMDALGLHDCAECGLCTYVCPSKIEFAEIFADGIEEFLREEEG